MSIKGLIYFLGFSLLFLSCGSGEKRTQVRPVFSLSDYYSTDPRLDRLVDSVFTLLTPSERIGQMIFTSAGTTGKPTKSVENLISKKAIGGVLMLSGEKSQLTKLAERFDSLAAMAGLTPLIYSADAEPSLINRKINGSVIVPPTVELQTIAKTHEVATLISNELRSMHIRYNYAPVVDLSSGNPAIKNRSFGEDSTTVKSLALEFIQTSEEKGIVTSAKHFPGHGLVSGDTHHQLVTIDGEMREAPMYKELIQSGIITVMVGHIAVINNSEYDTDGLPASCSRKIVTGLLRNTLGFKGIITTDAMNMGALKSIENPSLKAMEAGCDMILMEPNELLLLDLAAAKYAENPAFRQQIDESVKRILRLKMCLNLF
ncbi:MAG: glycoside hydrolase family 3 N-terminal domain-containing protein [Cyclobacteriaceae bacterium]|nr:glycoside hydrolase family 3 N-terminal domain-containing protein [Cyclobacteriaceae bacterium]